MHALPHEIISRFAPTPSGYLHVGNALNLMLTWLIVKGQRGNLRLRIDDLDRLRVKAPYLQDVFDTLNWLGLDWDEGPQHLSDHQQFYTQQQRASLNLEAIDQLIAGGAEVFASTCYRKDILAHSRDGRYPGTCYHQQHQLDVGKTALRIRVPAGTVIYWEDQWAGPQQVDLFAEMGDFVIRRKDGLAAYQIASLVDDEAYGINTIIRGQDLRLSTAAQLFLAQYWPTHPLPKVSWYHHPLIVDQRGEKLSKSGGDMSLQTWRSERTAAAFYDWVGQTLNLKGPIHDAESLLIAWQARGSDFPLSWSPPTARRE